jgi:hypothetical protein
MTILTISTIGLDAAEKQFGFSQSRETNEKITDGARGLYEKFSGSKVRHYNPLAASMQMIPYSD